MKKVYITIGGFYLYDFYVSEDYPQTNFISKIEWSATKKNADTFEEEVADKIRWQIDGLGFEYSKTGTEEVVEEEEE